MTVRLWRMPADGPPEPVADALPPLKELQQFVGGFVEHVRRTDGGQELHLFVNEDARSQGLARNARASAIYLASYGAQGVADCATRGADGARAYSIYGNVWLWRGPLPPDA